MYNFDEGEINNIPEDLINGLIELQPKGKVDNPGWIWFEVCDKYSDTCTKGKKFKIEPYIALSHRDGIGLVTNVKNTIKAEWYGCQELNSFALNYLDSHSHSREEELEVMVHVMTAQFYILKELYWEIGPCDDHTTSYLLAMHRQRQAIIDFSYEHNLPIDERIREWGGWILAEIMDTNDFWQDYDCDILPYFV